MPSKPAILQDLIESSDLKNLKEVRLSTLVKTGVGVAVGIAVLKAFKLPPPSKYSSLSSAVEFAKALVKARNPEESVAAAVGLLNIAARVLLSVPELKDLGYQVMKVVQSSRLEDFME